MKHHGKFCYPSLDTPANKIAGVLLSEIEEYITLGTDPQEAIAALSIAMASVFLGALQNNGGTSRGARDIQEMVRFTYENMSKAIDEEGEPA